jgi:hypothetical protein
MGFVEGETGYRSETCVMCDVDGTEEFSIEVEDPLDIKEEVSIKVEEAIDIKDGIPEVTTFQPINTEHEVRKVCVRWWQLMILGHLFAPKKESLKLILTISHFVLYCLSNIPVDIWVTILKGRDFQWS